MNLGEIGNQARSSNSPSAPRVLKERHRSPLIYAQSSYIETLVREYIFEFMEVTEMMKNKKNGTDGATDAAKSPARSRQAASTKSDDPDVNFGFRGTDVNFLESITNVKKKMQKHVDIC